MVKAMQQTSVSADSPVMTVKGSTTPVQVANSEFYVDPATGLFRTRTPSGSASGSARHLLQEVDPAARIASADFNLHTTGMMMSSNVFTQLSLFDSMSVEDDFNNTNFSSSARHLLATTSSTPAPATVLQPICDWSSDELFDIDSCRTDDNDGKPFYYLCKSMVGACQSFVYATKVSVPMWVQSYGDGTHSKNGNMCVLWACGCVASSHASTRRASLALGVTSIARYPNAKTITGTPCYAGLYRMYTNSAMDSWLDLCLTALPNNELSDAGCTNCPVGPFLDYTYLVRSPRCLLNFTLSELGFLTITPIRRNTTREHLTSLASLGSRSPMPISGIIATKTSHLKLATCR